jgi:two-component system cell cycle response regulator
VKSDRPSSVDPGAPPQSLRPASRLEQKTLNTEVFSLRPAQQRDRAVLVRMDSAQAGQVTSLDAPEIRLGRQLGNSIVIDDEGLSRVHARVYYDGIVYRIQDLRSSNGTYVNGTRIDEAPLTDGSVLQLGPKVCFRFSLTDENQERILQKLYENSVHDPLTGAYNRLFFLERLSAELSYAARHKAPASLLMFDVDRFKAVNDTYGHPAGDAVLKQIAATARELVRVEDVLARYGGEEFVVLLRGIGLSGAGRAAERIRVSIEKAPTLVDGQAISTTVSIGAASLACIGKPDSDALISVADRRLYLAKNGGRNRVVSQD